MRSSYLVMVLLGASATAIYAAPPYLGMPPATTAQLATPSTPPTPVPTSTPTPSAPIPSTGYAAIKKTDQKNFFSVDRNSRGTTLEIPEAEIIPYCSDVDGCHIRMGMYNWDNTQRVASREFLFFYNANNKNWRSSYGDAAGTNSDNTTSHIAGEVWSCYFTDGKYANFVNKGDPDPSFGLLSWNQYNADCWMTVED